jgi:hypothetical protein
MRRPPGTTLAHVVKNLSCSNRSCVLLRVGKPCGVQSQAAELHCEPRCVFSVATQELLLHIELVTVQALLPHLQDDNVGCVPWEGRQLQRLLIAARWHGPPYG